MTTHHDHADQQAQDQRLAAASHHAKAAARPAEHTQAARSVDCECPAPAGTPCGPSGDHLARYLRAHQSGALTRDSLKEIIAELDVITPCVLIQPPGERATPLETAITSRPSGPARMSAGMSADQAGASAQSMPGRRSGAPAPAGEALSRSDAAPSPIGARRERELEAGS